MHRWIATIGLVCVVACEGARAQQSIGSVGIADATVAGALEVSNGRAILMGASTVTAKDHTADVALNRGGSVKVCSTSGLHLTAGKGALDAPLMLALDRGAIEVATRITTNDVVMTPDLRFTVKSAGPLDLRLRVARNGDTCVENRGAAAPVVSVADQFGDSSYEIKSGQHVLFEHGSLKEVVDNESEPCGCPAEPVVSVAEAGATGGTPAPPGSAVASQTAEEQHPFPAAVSAGLAPTSGPPQAPAGVVHAQVSTTMSYGSSTDSSSADGDAGSAASDSTAESASAGVAANAPASSTTTAGRSETTAAAPGEAPAAAPATVKAEATPQPPAPPAGDVIHAIGRFFKKLFGGH
jgi:hypothetical protein